MGHGGQFKAKKWKPPKAPRKMDNPANLANGRRAIGTSNNFVNDMPRKVRHHNAAELPREGNPRVGLLLTALLTTQYGLDAQAEMNLRTRPYTPKESPIIPEPPSSSGADAASARSGMPADPAPDPASMQPNSMDLITGTSLRYGNGAARNMTFASDAHNGRDSFIKSGREPSTPATLRTLSPDLAAESPPTPSPGPTAGLLAPLTSYGTAANALLWSALEWLNPLSRNSADPDYMPSAWPLPGNEAARHRITVTAAPTGRHHHHHHHHHHHRNSTAAATQPILYQIIPQIISRRELGEFIMRKYGLDPHEFRKLRYTAAGGTPIEEMMTGIDIYIFAQQPDWLGSYRTDKQIEKLPALNDIFFKFIDSVKIQAKHNITRELTNTAHHHYKFPAYGPANNKTHEPYAKLMGSGTYVLKSINVEQPIAGKYRFTDTSSIGYVVDVSDATLYRNESYVIAPAHHPPLIRIPTNENEQIEWLTRHANLFFNTKLETPWRLQRISTKTIDAYANFLLLIQDVADKMSTAIVDAFKNEAFDETRREKMLNFIQWHIPFYAAWLAYKRHEYSEMAVRAVLDVIALAGGPFAKALKTAGIVLKSGKLVTIAKHLQKLGYLDAPGQVDNLKKKILSGAAERIAGPAGRVFSDYVADEINQSADYNSLNQLVDGANSDRGRNQAQISGVMRNN